MLASVSALTWLLAPWLAVECLCWLVTGEIPRVTLTVAAGWTVAVWWQAGREV